MGMESAQPPSIGPERLPERRDIATCAQFPEPAPDVHELRANEWRAPLSEFDDFSHFILLYVDVARPGILPAG
jgi:hypothetical protein